MGLREVLANHLKDDSEESGTAVFDWEYLQVVEGTL